ncbi:hypothetical protein HDU96_006404 [Phlyctochytrium bullatum]|nr:hypothetical protein HDU96_006404 [Phlyctochytrium bullatum]
MQAVFEQVSSSTDPPAALAALATQLRHPDLTRNSLVEAYARFSERLRCPLGHLVPEKSFDRHVRRCARKNLGTNALRRPRSARRAYGMARGVVTLVRPVPGMGDAEGEEERWETVETPFGTVRRKLGLDPERNGLVFEVLDGMIVATTPEERLRLYEKERQLCGYLQQRFGSAQRTAVDRLDSSAAPDRKGKAVDRREKSQQQRKYRANSKVKLRRRSAYAVSLKESPRRHPERSLDAARLHRCADVHNDDDDIDEANLKVSTATIP